MATTTWNGTTIDLDTGAVIGKDGKSYGGTIKSGTSGGNTGTPERAGAISSGYVAEKPKTTGTPSTTSTQSGTYIPLGQYNDKDASQQDREKIDAISRQYEQAKSGYMADGVITPNEQATLDGYHQQAEAIRNQYGYSGGVDGSEYVRLQTEQPQKTAIRTPTSQADYINQLYEAQQKVALQKLQSAYDQNVIDLNAAAAKIPATYQTARNQVASTAAINQRSFDERAAANGINSGAGSQASLAMSNQLQGDLTNINTQQANAVNDIETQRLKFSTAYQDAIAQAIAEGELQRASTLYQEAVRVDNSLMQQSQAQADENYRYWTAQQDIAQNTYKMLQTQADKMAAHGDFSGYLAMGYPEETVARFQKIWAAQNPLLARVVDGGETTSTYKYSAGGGSGGVNSNGGGNNDSLFDGGGTPSLKASLNYTEDEGIFTWNGKNYSKVNTLLTDLDNANLSDADKEALKRKFGMYGFDISF